MHTQIGVMTTTITATLIRNPLQTHSLHIRTNNQTARNRKKKPHITNTENPVILYNQCGIDQGIPFV
jgi:hypothetical protein